MWERLMSAPPREQRKLPLTRAIRCAKDVGDPHGATSGTIYSAHTIPVILKDQATNFVIATKWRDLDGWREDVSFCAQAGAYIRLTFVSLSSRDHLVLGVDVGSTTVKAVVVDPHSREILWSDYQRHETRQAEKVMELLVGIGDAFQDIPLDRLRVFITGSGAGPLREPLGAKFVQEVNAVTMAVDRLHPDVGSVIELGGQVEI